MDNKWKIVDEKGRDLLICHNAEMAIARYIDSPKENKEYIAEVYSYVTGEDKNKVLSFLNFEDNNEFCA